MRRIAIAIGALAVLAAVAAVSLPRAETPDERVVRIASELRCPVCQGLSVNDSPSASAREMRAIIERRVAEGRSDDEISDEFRAAYGDWILLAPPADDPRGLIWLVPLIATAAGLLLVLSRLRGPATAPRPTSEQLALLRERARLDEGGEA